MSCPHLLAVPLVAAISAAPDYSAVVGGIEIVVFAALATVSVFMVVGFIRRKLGE